MSDPRAKGGKGGSANAKADANKKAPTTQSARAGLQVGLSLPQAQARFRSFRRVR